MQRIVRLLFMIITSLLLVSVIWLIFFRATPTDTEVVTTKQVVDYADAANSEVRLTIEGNIVAQEEFRSIRITVSDNQRTFEILQGYEGSAEERKTFNNNPNAYRTFLTGLQNTAFMATQDPDPTILSDAACPQGRRFRYEIIEAGEVVHSSWSTSCSRRHGNFAGDQGSVIRLFQLQIPEYNDLSRGLGLN